MVKLRVTAALTSAASALVLLGSPANAWPGWKMTCDPMHRAYSCTLVSSGTPAPSNMRWFQKVGTTWFHLSAWDDLTNARSGCGANQVVTIRIKFSYVYPDGYVWKVSATDTVRCEGNQ